MSKKIVSIILLIFWLSLIFYFSSQDSKASTSTSKGIEAKVLETVNITLSEEKFDKVNGYSRIFAHFFEYLVLGILFFNLLHVFELKKAFLFSLIFSLLYSISDEIHQIFVPGRSFEFFDLTIDFLGYFLGCYLYRKITLRECKKVI